MTTQLTCRDERRRRLVRGHRDGLNGIDYVDVGDDQRTLTVYFLRKAPPEVTPANVRIEGGRRIRDIAVTDVRMCRVEDEDIDDCMVLTLDRFGDFSPYRLHLVDVAGFDPRYATAEFSFKVGCPSDADCRVPDDCPEPVYDEPELSYLAKDYASFRQLMLDRLTTVMPDWQDRQIPDVGVTLVELLAYVGDYLSYHQDAVATEAYLHTARLRPSVRRHARLVDYFMHEGCNARAWVCVETDKDVKLPDDVSFITGNATAGPDRTTTWTRLAGTDPATYAVFQPVERRERELWKGHGEIRFHTWGDAECCLPRGATAAAFLSPRARPLHLAPGDVLILEEVKGPRTGDPADADPRHRHAVMLTSVSPGKDPVTGDTIVEVEWSPDDALPFALCLSAVTAAPACEELTDVSVARGNVVLVDHGRPVRDEELGTVEVASTREPCGGACGEGIVFEPARFRPGLDEGPLTFAVPLPSARSARALSALPDPRSALPQVEAASMPLTPAGDVALFVPADIRDPRALAGRLRDPEDADAQTLLRALSAATRELLEQADPSDELSTALREALIRDLRALRKLWRPRLDLLSSGSGDRQLVVEVDNEGVAHLRFGDGVHGRRPAAHAPFSADYRIGNGPSGNVGADTITRLVFDRTVLARARLRPRNPLPAWGGTAAESIVDVKLRAPDAFRRELARAVTADDHARLAERVPGVQRAAATLRWTGSWPEVRVAIDAVGGDASAELLRQVREHLEAYRRIGYDIVVVAATEVPLRVGLRLCVEPWALRAHVEADVRRALSSRTLPGGGLGFFHPDAFTFGDDVYVSALVARAQAVPGVESVTVTALQRLHGVESGELGEGVLRLGVFEVAQLAADPNFPEHGRLELKLEGGR